MQVENAFLFVRDPHTGEFLAYVTGPNGYQVFKATSGTGVIVKRQKKKN